MVGRTTDIFWWVALLVNRIIIDGGCTVGQEPLFAPLELVLDNPPYYEHHPNTDTTYTGKLVQFIYLSPNVDSLLIHQMLFQTTQQSLLVHKDSTYKAQNQIF